MTSRNFIVENSSTGISGYRYKADTPMHAAEKAAKRILGTNKKATFCVRETTKDSKKKTYYYVAHIEKSKNDIKYIVKANKQKKYMSGGYAEEQIDKFLEEIFTKNEAKEITIEYEGPQNSPDSHLFFRIKQYDNNPLITQIHKYGQDYKTMFEFNNNGKKYKIIKDLIVADKSFYTFEYEPDSTTKTETLPDTPYEYK